MTNEDMAIAQLTAQITGFAHGKRGYYVTQLVEAAGMTVDEWHHPDVQQVAKQWLSEKDFDDLQSYMEAE